MSSILQVCLYNQDAESSETLRHSISSLNFVRLVTEVNTPDELAALMRDHEINLLFLHLDPDADSVVEVIDQVSQHHPTVPMIALSHQTGPNAILAPIRAGCDQYVCEPIVHADLAAAVSRVAAKRLLTQGRSKCVCVTGASGGVGATSIACNLAMEIGHLGDKNCGLVDLNLQFGDLATNFDREPDYTIHDIATAGAGVDQTVLENVLTVLPCNVALLARPRLVGECDGITADVVHHVIELLTTMHESVVIDIPRFISPVTFAALQQADLILIVCQLLVPSIRNAERYFDALVKLGIPEDRIEVIVNRGDSSGGRVSAKDIEELIKKPVFATIPNDYQYVAQSLDFGRPIAAAERDNPVRTEIRRLAGKISGYGESDLDKATRRRGFFGRRRAKQT